MNVLTLTTLRFNRKVQQMNKNQKSKE